MLFNSVDFFLFYPIAVFMFFLVPTTWKNRWLLVTSYFFYMCWEPIFIFLILYTTVISYVTSILLEKGKYRKCILGIGIAMILSNLLWFKYAEFFIDILNQIFIHILPRPLLLGFDIILPVGISFFTFQAISYVIDVYRGEVEVERVFVNYALYIAFFPQLVAGPIERAKTLLGQFKEEHVFQIEHVKKGLLTMLWGYFLKLVIADRIALFVDNVYRDYQKYNGGMLMIANMLFAFQLYCDFAGYSTIAVGSARVMGFRLVDNFKSPFLAQSTAELWRRWHISLSSWFKEYLYFPLGGSRKGKVRKYINIFIVFCVSGLWHGADLTFLLWGFLNGLYQILGEITFDVRNKVKGIIFVQRRHTMVESIISTMITFGLFVSTMVFFRASNMKEALNIIEKMYCNIDSVSVEMFLSVGLSRANWLLLLIAICMLIIVDICKLRNISIYNIINAQRIAVRWGIYLFAIIFVIVFGVYGADTGAFIYFAF